MLSSLYASATNMGFHLTTKKQFKNEVSNTVKFPRGYLSEMSKSLVKS